MNIDAQDAQDNQDGRLLQETLTRAMIVCGFEDVREHKPAVSGKNPVHPVHRCESQIYSCLTLNRAPAPPTTVRITQRKNSRSSMKTNHQWTRIGTRTDGPPSTTTGAKMLLHFCPVGVTLSWEEVPPGARASRPHKSSRSFGHLLHRNQPAAAPCLCFGRAHAVPAGRAVGCNIAGKLSGNRRDSMRAGRPRSRGCRPDGEVEGIRRATSLKAGLSPLGNSRLPASRAPAPRDWADPSRRTIN